MKAARRKSDPPSGSLPLAGLRFAIYARKSTADARHEDHTSTARQVANARAYVERGGGEVLSDQIYVDEATSGAEFQERPGLLRLLNALENGHSFNAVVMSDEDRLGREQYRTNVLLQQLSDANCRIFLYFDGREVVLDSATAKFMQSVRNFGSELEREKARQRARDAAERKARQGYVTGGEPYGYENVHYQGDKEVPRGAPHDFTKRRIQEDEAEVVRGIFRMYAAGWGMTKIAKAMNGVPAFAEQNREFFGGQRVPPPRKRTGSWSPTMVREMLIRPLYHGEVVWGQTTRIDKDGRAGLRIPRGKDGWVLVPAPELQIVPDDLWEAVQERLKTMRETYLRDVRGKLWAKPDLRRAGRYLLTDLAKCGCCGWNLAVIGNTPRMYGCAHHSKRGVCGNNLRQSVALVEAAFLGALERECLTPERFAYALRCGVERVQEQASRRADYGPTLERERASLLRKIQRMVEAIGDGQGPASLVQEISKAEARVKVIERELARLAAIPSLEALGSAHVEDAVAEQLSRFTDLLGGNGPRGRQALKKLLVDEVLFTPIDIGSSRQTYEFKGELSYGAIVRETIYLESVPSGIRWPLEGRDSRGCATRQDQAERGVASAL